MEELDRNSDSDSSSASDSGPSSASDSDPSSASDNVEFRVEADLYSGDFFDNLSIGITRLIFRLEMVRWQKFKLSQYVPEAKDYMIFMRAVKYKFHSQFHAVKESYFNDSNESGIEDSSSRWNDVYEISCIGKTSYTLHGVIENEQQGPKKLVDFLLKFVRIDPSTRRPIPLGDDVIGQHASLVGSGTDIARPGALLNENRSKLISEFTIQSNHIDLNNHANFSVYILFSEKMAIKAAAEKFYPSVRGELNVDDIETFTIYYERECSLGDTVHVHTWEGASRQLHFQAFKGETLLSYIIMTLFDAVPLSVL